jgi:hypothetical protein
MHYCIHFARDEYEISYIMLVEFKIGISGEMSDVFRIPGYEVIHPYNTVAFKKQAVTKMGT